MPVAQVRNKSGVTASTQPVILVKPDQYQEGPAKEIVKLLTLYNPNSSAVSFLIQYVIYVDDREVRIRRFDDSIPATDSWSFGMLGAVMVVENPNRLELVLDSEPTEAIEWSADIAVAV